MKLLRSIFGVGAIVVIGLMLAAPVSAVGGGQPVFRQIDITGDEFVVIQNGGDGPLELGNYWLGYSSDASATAGPSAKLPTVTLQKGQAIILSNQPTATCGAVAAGDLPFTLANSDGKISIWKLDISSANFSKISAISWGKMQPTTSDYLDIDDETSGDSDWYRSADSGTSTWQVGHLDNCAFTPVKSIGAPVGVNWPADNQSPPFAVLPATIINNAGGSNLPASDVGLKPPIVNELLPNPASPQTDSEDEFIELYNPNSASFDLSGFELETGSTSSSSRHDYTFPSSTKIAGKSFEAFKSEDTSISLSNGGGQAWLKDPFGKVVSQSSPYGEAKDGLAFALAGGEWQWTIQPTPDAENIIQLAGQSSSGKDSSSKSEPVAAVKGAGTTTPSARSTSGASSLAGDEQPVAVHTSVLVLVALLALGYGTYEYRHDISNKIFQLRKYRAARRATRR